MKRLIRLRCAMVFCLTVAGLAVFGQPLLELGTEKIDPTALRKLYAGPQVRQTAKMSASSNASAAQETKKLIVVNPTTLDNTVLSLANGVDETTLKVTPLLLAELRNAGLDYAEEYDCIVADVTPSGEYASRDLIRVGVPDQVRMPQFRYGRKGDVRLAAHSERKIKSVGLNVPMPIFGSEVSDEEFQRAFEKNRQLALGNGWYTYEYVLPNGDLTTYADFGEADLQPAPSGADAIGEDNGLNAGIVISDWTGKINSYNVEPLTSDAKASMQAGAEKWMDALSIKVPVIAKVGFTGDYGSGSSTLGSSWSPPTYIHNGVAYPAALIDQILEDDMHPSQDYDIRIVYNKDYSFYYGASTSCPSTKHDFQGIVTHELCHGLGFTSYHYRGSNGSSPDGSWSTSYVSIFDTFLYYSTGRLPSLTQATRKTAFTSNALYWDGPNAIAANGGSRIKMYAPSTYKGGSSVSHWDDSVTFTTFMKRAVSSGVVLREIDSRLLGAFKDMGWELNGDDPPAPTRPVNDNFANATAISGTSGSLTLSSTNATKENGEPYHGVSSATNSVWWKWTAPAAGSMTITTEGSGFDTGLGVYTGSAVSSLTKITANDDNGAGGRWSSVTYSAVAQTTYYIAVAGYQGATGMVKLNWNFSGAAIASPTITDYGGYTTYTYIEWNSVSGATGYRIYRAMSSSSRPSTPYATVSSSSTVYCDYNGTPGVTYYYWLSAVGSAGESVSGPISTYRRADFATLSPMSLSFDGLGGSQTVSVGANTSWQATKPTTATWLTLSKTGTDGNGTLNVTAAANTSSSARSATITLTAASGTAHPVTRTISVSQSAKSTISLATALDNTTLTFTTGGNVNWLGQTTNTHDGVDAAQSGKIGANQSSWMQTTVTGPGIISFWWYASSESVNYDYLAFSVDGTQKDKIGGTSLSWAKRSYELGSGTHTLKWTYEKDGSVSRGEDAGFVDQVTWTDNIVTEVRNLGIGFVSGGKIYELTLKNGGKIAFYDAWLTDAGISTSGGITTSLLNAIGRNGLPRYQSYLFGFDPESTIPAEEQLKPTIEFDAAGTPIISCIPKMVNDLVTYTTLGKPSLNAADWVVVTPSNKASMKFFKVKVELAK